MEIPGLLGLWAGLAGAALAYSRTRATGRLARDLGFRVGAWWDLPVGAAVGLGCQYGLVPLLYLPFEHLDHHLAHKLSQPATKEAGAAHGTVGATVAFVVLALGAPIVEELFFRGLLLRSLSAWTRPLPAVVATGLVFGLAHFEAAQFAGLAVFGMVLAVLARATGRLGPGIAAHVAFNVVAVASVVQLT